jgi:thiamine pyrophosphokinase
MAMPAKPRLEEAPAAEFFSEPVGTDCAAALDLALEREAAAPFVAGVGGGVRIDDK